MSKDSSSPRAAVKICSECVVLAAALLTVSCGLAPEHVSRDDPRLKPLFEAMTRVNRESLGFTPLEHDAVISVEWRGGILASMLMGPKSYDAMLHVSAKTSRTVAFKRHGEEYEWIGEQQRFQGPHEYDSVDGHFTENITITYERVPIYGFPINTTSVSYTGDQPELVAPRQLSLDTVRPWLKKWGYD
jgi:hypothetical protein